MKKPVIRKADTNAEILTDERCFITEFSNLPDDPPVSISRARVAPGTTTAWHRLDGITERYLITGGRARVEIGGYEPTDIEAGDVVIIPDGVRQRVTNVGDTDLVFLCICTPRFEWKYYQRLEP